MAPEWTNHVVIEGQQNQIVNDITHGQLATVSWVIPNGNASDRPGNEGNGPSWVASIVNAIGTSQYWKDTAIIITWDDWETDTRIPGRTISPIASTSIRRPCISDDRGAFESGVFSE